MSKYIKAFNYPFLKYETNEVTRIINIEDLDQILYNEKRAFLYSKRGDETEINVEVAMEIDEFLMGYKKFDIEIPYIDIPGGIKKVSEKVGDVDLHDWLYENN